MLLSRRRAMKAVLTAAGALAAAALIGTPLVAITAVAEPAVYTGLVKGVAVGGYDAVAYFTQGRAVAGRPEFSLKHKGADWRFASAANLAAFTQAPEKYEPQYGGYCAYAVASGSLAKGDPTQWKIVGDKLYLNYSRSVQQTWEKNPQSFIGKADTAWPKLR